MRVEAPWTEEQVANLCEWQRGGFVHPFTCPEHGGIAVPDGASDVHWFEVLLLPTRTGWVCSDRSCDYTQSWAHGYMVMRACPECGGNGSELAHALGCWGTCEKHGCPVQVECGRCRGSGILGEANPVNDDKDVLF